MSDEDKQRRGRKASKGRKARGHRTGGRNARSLRNSTRQERQELYLRWRSESFDEETNQFIGEYSTFEEFYNVWSTLDNACEPAHDATGNHSPTSHERQSPLGEGRPRAETDVSVSDVVETGEPIKLVAVPNGAAKAAAPERARPTGRSCVRVLAYAIAWNILVVVVTLYLVSVLSPTD